MEHLEEVQAYWNQRAKGFSVAVQEELASSCGREWARFFQDHLPDGPLDILDDGTGAGFFAVILSRLGHRVTAIDYSDQMILRARERFDALGLPVATIQMDVQNLRFEKESFDAVVTRNVLWNLDSPKRAYQEINRVLRPGGTVIVDDGNMYLYLHNTAYAAARERNRAQASKGLHDKYNVDHVDFSIMEKIAEDLPMSSTLRPIWDFQQLVSLGFSDIHITLRGGDLPTGFRIVARKKGNEDWRK